MTVASTRSDSLWLKITFHAAQGKARLSTIKGMYLVINRN
jgi:hypothetical protein